MNNAETIQDLIQEPIKTGEGLIAYRKYLLAIKYIQKKIEKIKKYKEDVVVSIDKKIETLESQESQIRDVVKSSMLADPSVENTKQGGKSISLPDVGSASVSKINHSVNILSDEKAIGVLGNEYIKIVPPKLNTTKAKKYLEENIIKTPDGKIVLKDTAEVIDWVETKESRTFTIKFQKYTSQNEK
jgi:hypothetical protein